MLTQLNSSLGVLKYHGSNLEKMLPFFIFTGTKYNIEMKRKITLLIPVFLISFFTLQSQVNNAWVVPEEYIEMENPVDADKKSISKGKTLYKQHCKLCHGKKGQGEGYHTKNLKVDPSDLTLEDIDVQKDGELFYKIKTGRDEMHSYKVVLGEKDVWNLVNYIRTFYSEE